MKSADWSKIFVDRWIIQRILRRLLGPIQDHYTASGVVLLLDLVDIIKPSGWLIAGKEAESMQINVNGWSRLKIETMLNFYCMRFRESLATSRGKRSTILSLFRTVANSMSLNKPVIKICHQWFLACVFRPYSELAQIWKPSSYVDMMTGCPWEVSFSVEFGWVYFS